MSVEGVPELRDEESGVPYWNKTDHPGTERHLREALRHCRLVGELDLSHDQPLFQMAQWVFEGATRAGNYSGLWKYPAATAIYLVAQGRNCYNEGTFWPNIESLKDCDSLTQNLIGSVFEESVRKLKLENFIEAAEADRWFRFVSPILLHGGIPNSCAIDAARLVFEEMQAGAQHAEEILDNRVRIEIQRGRLQAPLQRFFMYGGDFAIDTLNRLISAVRDVDAVGIQLARQSVSELADDHRLPRYLIDALVNRVMAARSRVSRSRHSRRQPRPTVRIDPYSGSGPYVLLPRVVRDGQWHLTGDSPRRYVGSRHDSLDVQLEASPHWTVELRSDERRLKWRFDGHRSSHCFVFDLSGRLAREQHKVKGHEALLLVAKGLRVTAPGETPLRFTEELPPLMEPWHNWRLISADISSIDCIELHTDTPANLCASLPVVHPPKGPTLNSHSVAQVAGPDGVPVHARAPTVSEPIGTPASAWKAHWRSDDRATGRTPVALDKLPSNSQGRDTSQLFKEGEPVIGSLEVVGPLGSDLRERFAVFPGLDVLLPDRVIAPDEAVEGTVIADCSLALPNGTTGQALSILFPGGCDNVEVSAGDITLGIHLPRLLWTVGRRGKSTDPFQGDPVQIPFDEIESGKVESLIVRCGRPATLRLEVIGKDVLQHADPVRVGGTVGRWAFGLAQFRDTIRNSSLPSVMLRLSADDVVVDAIRVRAQYEVSDLEVTVADSHGIETLLDATWSENRSFKHRQLALWSQHRLWEQPTLIDVPPENTGHLDFIVEVPPGPYLTDLHVHDDWLPLQRPMPSSQHTSQISIGLPRACDQRLCNLRPFVGTEALELVVADHPLRRAVNGCSLRDLDSELLDALEVASNASTSGALERLLQLALSVDDFLAEVLLNDLIWELSPTSALRVMFGMLALSLQHPESTQLSLRDADLESLWEASPLIASVLDCSGDSQCRERWRFFTGWAPDFLSDGPEQPREPVSAPLDGFDPERLSRLADAVSRADSLPLQSDGYATAAIEMLANTWPDRVGIHSWMSAHSRVTTYTQRFSDQQHRQVRSLAAKQPCPSWHQFPSRLLTAAFQVVDRYSARSERAAAEQALLYAYEFAPKLTTRSLLTATALRVAELCEDRELDHVW